ncbi:NAD-dependent deacetylase [Longibacter salinarum]|uniref:protein acetyllysine N-acetyltransferase n=2 Tax=Longibacter salinarum TaxID=1850348 RepID=A0A2A8CV23_9BACT|nr:NAD-dependent deacetylase [Longibacter salinarum]
MASSASPFSSVPAPDPTPSTSLLDALAGLLLRRDVAVLSGAGASTESGIPDYRGPQTREKARNPMRYRAFTSSADARRHYWARSAIGWDSFSAAEPNDGHHALGRLERAGCVRGVVTQNVDGLHQAGGSDHVVELHGSLAEVICLDCRQVESRHAFQERLLDRNPGWLSRVAEIAPDGDADLSVDETIVFDVAPCQQCGGAMKPNVVFFGEDVPDDRTDAAWELVDECEALLVVGSSLTVYSGFRFVRAMAKRRSPVAIVNLGPTRGDDLALMRINGRTGTVLPRLASLLGV